MAFTEVSLRYMLEDAVNRNLRYSGTVLTLSRYTMGFGAERFNQICKEEAYPARIVSDNKYDGWIYDERVFKALGFDKVDTMDYSPYEGAELIFDLNSKNMNDDLLQKYDYILDGGTLEHVFDYPQALRNIFKMLKVGGTFIFDQPAYYGLNHGFYGLSTCLFNDYFTANHYQINKIALYMYKLNEGYFAELKGIGIHDEPQIVEDYHYMIWGSVTKTPASTGDATPYQGKYEAAWGQMRLNAKRYMLELSKAGEYAVYLYGTKFTARHLAFLASKQFANKIAGFVSNDASEIGTVTPDGFRVFDMNDLVLGNMVIIASMNYQEVIYQRIKEYTQKGIQIVKIFESR